MTKAPDEIHRLFAGGTLSGLSDGQLLERFADRGDGDAPCSDRPGRDGRRIYAFQFRTDREECRVMKPIEPATRIVPATALAATAAVAFAVAGEAPTPSIRAVMHRQYTVYSAPFKAIKREADAPSPDWEKVRQAAEKYAALEKLLVEQTPPEGSRESWRRRVEEQSADARSIEEAARSHDAKALRATQERITASCKGCHDAHR
jgi:cytochrome c556